ncbi:hypothetical protein C5167_018901 [Papaver somniferum]|uniref:Replication factor A C-terminal domain-containing protein n=1 Tax=Papaver somniferum TaxID=3469 RepID=A0A4Y7INL7_PAPSO|nr:uncharacterized protein LOC113348389 [Papaver somniferum]RZC50473.1 hypothetical protein C5167_018901 [Papaver somniferum]
MQSDQPLSVFCTVMAMNTTDFCYLVCSQCEKTLPNEFISCKYCDPKFFNPGSSNSKRLYRILVPIAASEEVFVVVMFDRVARVLIGCSADEFFNFTTVNPSAAVTASKLLEGKMFQMKLSKRKMNGNAQHLRAISVTPLCSDFTPAIKTLKELYKDAASPSHQSSCS